MTPRRSPDAGFTLIETLVALAVLALSSVALLGATEAHIARLSALEARAAAAWTAENYLTEVALGLQPSVTPVPMLGFEFSLSQVAEPTRDPDLQKLVISAVGATDGRRYARLTGFVLTEFAQVGP